MLKEVDLSVSSGAGGGLDRQEQGLVSWDFPEQISFTGQVFFTIDWALHIAMNCLNVFTP